MLFTIIFVILSIIVIISIIFHKNKNSDIISPSRMNLHDLTKDITYESEALDAVDSITNKVNDILWEKIDQNLIKNGKRTAKREDVLNLLNELKTENQFFKEIKENEL